MHRRAVTQRVAENISDAILAAGTDASTIARAADIDSAEFESRLDASTDLTLGELVRVGGALSVSPASLLEGVAA